jgi:hypothetical protein
MVTLQWFVRSCIERSFVCVFHIVCLCIVRSFRVSCVFRIVRSFRLLRIVSLYDPGSVAAILQYLPSIMIFINTIYIVSLTYQYNLPGIIPDFLVDTGAYLFSFLCCVFVFCLSSSCVLCVQCYQCLWFVFILCRVCPMLPVYLNGSLLIAPSVFSCIYYTPAPRRGRGVYCFTSVLLSVQDIFRRIFLCNCWWQKSDIWSQASYRYTILWVAFFDLSDSYFLFADLVGFYTNWTYMHIFCHIFLSNYWWQKSDIWSQASYRYPISWEAFLDPSDSYVLFAEVS